MNDFTKEELKSILDWANVYCESGGSWSYEVHKPLIIKIMSMIDNYCEHEEDDTTFWKIYIEVEKGRCIEETTESLAYFQDYDYVIKFGHKSKGKNSMIDEVISRLIGLKD